MFLDEHDDLPDSLQLSSLRVATHVRPVLATGRVGRLRVQHAASVARTSAVYHSESLARCVRGAAGLRAVHLAAPEPARVVPVRGPRVRVRVRIRVNG